MPGDARVFHASSMDGHPTLVACSARVEAMRRSVPSLRGTLVLKTRESAPLSGQDKEMLWVVALSDGSVTRYRMDDLAPWLESPHDAPSLEQALEWYHAGDPPSLDAQAVVLCALHRAKAHCILRTLDTSCGVALDLAFSDGLPGCRVIQNDDLSSAIGGMGEELRGSVLWGSRGIVAWADEAESCVDAGLSLVETIETRLRAFQTDEPPPPHPLAPVLRGLWSEQQGPVICVRLPSECEEAVMAGVVGSEYGSCAPLPVRRFERGEENEPAGFRPLEHDVPSSPQTPFIAVVAGEGVWSVHRDAAVARAAAALFQRFVALHEQTGGCSKSKRLSGDEWAWMTRKAVPPLEGRIAFITGAGSGIGLAIAHRLLEEGACVYMADVNADKLGQELETLRMKSSVDRVSGMACDVRDAGSVQRAFDEVVATWGGLDILVNCAGLSLSRSLEDTTPEQYDLQNDVMPRGSFLCSREAAKIMRLQGRGGDIVYIASKNGLFAGPNNVAYGTAKAAQIHQARLLAAELAAIHVRVNVVNPDAVVRGSGIFGGGWGEDRARTYGVKLEELGKYYASRSLLHEEVFPEDIAAAVYVLVGPELRKSTGLIINVDSGFAPAMVR